ncbi:hypothetical protein PUNSTDRAFT_67281 [Punctularia strigosozonata HHB-11173 SS5]|uniref:uncharacterized protein n=1 Tax=Punctularia strigosozonata (strain HHB-11173) TaxID=741275 RepID=UPI00044177E6|nr:uncharacterized protein PUNSTDRAFT_67281 [Punctularia strigosozonata HHB-11173 SS5]EIN08943.1 hypothetical protein PUNSTDRAFT_67281 [Punctularia strigosozonata HHB-11173 SS5]
MPIKVPKSFGREGHDLSEIRQILQEGPTISRRGKISSSHRGRPPPVAQLPQRRTLIQTGFYRGSTSLAYEDIPYDPESCNSDARSDGARVDEPVDVLINPETSSPFATPTTNRFSSPLHFPTLDTEDDAANYKAQYARKKANQWRRWQTETIPELITPYMDYIWATSHMADPPSLPRCTCQEPGRKLSVLAVYCERLAQIDLSICTCMSAARQLLARGLFPCAPQSPSLAFDLNMLELVSTLFLNVAPNVTAWTTTLESFLGVRKFRLKTQDSLRRRFNNALNWYIYLIDHVKEKTIAAIEAARKAIARVSNIEGNCSTTSTASAPPTSSARPRPSVVTGRGRASNLAEDSSAPLTAAVVSAPTAPPRAPVAAGGRETSTLERNLSPTTTPSMPPTSSARPRPPVIAGRGRASNLAEDSLAPPTSAPTSARSSTTRSRASNAEEDPSPPGAPRSTASSDGWPTAPSEYLRSRCLLCFSEGAPSDCDDSPDVIICLDACFTQKRCATGGRDPARRHPASVFIPEAEVLAMEKLLAERKKTQAKPAKARPQTNVSSGGPSDGDTNQTTRKRKRKEASTSIHCEDDRCEGPLKLPNSVLDGCEASFKAADEQREKASTRFFDDTALMALVCRHDRVLWLANMTSAGERQHYAIALLEKFFQHVPSWMQVGLLYDIGCQLERSCYRWDLLPEYRNRITFGISVFHAYGHQWECQVFYHPRKCKGFGLSDGESCERLWSSLDHLVPPLRVSGFYQRLYVLDRQIHHLDGCHRRTLGDWLARKHHAYLMRLIAAERGLAHCKIPREVLWKEWDAQRMAQTKPKQRQTKDAGTKVIESILLIQDQLRVIEKTIADVERKILTGRGDASTTSYLEELLDEQSRARAKKHNLENGLDLRSRQNLESLRGSKYLTHRVNALALKTRLRDRLRNRKSETSRVERSFRSHSSNKKLASHTQIAVLRREQGIEAVARKYNKLCSEMAELIRKRQAPARAVPPVPIKLESLWSLDVDDDIWQDTGLFDDEGEGGSPPRWLADEKVRDGIRHMLEADRCREEGVRIAKERKTMQRWLQDEWSAVNYALNEKGIRPGLAHQLSIQRDELLALAVVWRRDVAAIPADPALGSSWGPTEVEMTEAICRDVSKEAELGPELEDDAYDPDDYVDAEGRLIHLEDDPADIEDLAALCETVEELRLNVEENYGELWRNVTPSTPRLSSGISSRMSSLGPFTPISSPMGYDRQSFTPQAARTPPMSRGLQSGSLAEYYSGDYPATLSKRPRHR